MSAAEEKPIQLGGMALKNGLLIHGPTSWSAAVRTPEGEIVGGSGRKPKLAPGLVAKVPGLRGPVRLGEAMAVLPVVRMSLPEVRLPFEDRGTLASVALSFAGSAAARRIAGKGAAAEAAGQALGAVPAVVGLRDRTLARYHGVEHKMIAAHERGSDDPASMPKEHDRCGSNLILPLMVLSVAGSLMLERLVEKPGPLARGAVGLAAASAAVEMFVYSDRNPERPFSRGFHRLGRAIQSRFATAEPDADELAVGQRALELILEAEGAAPGAGPAPAPG